MSDTYTNQRPLHLGTNKHGCDCAPPRNGKPPNKGTVWVCPHLVVWEVMHRLGQPRRWGRAAGMRRAKALGRYAEQPRPQIAVLTTDALKRETTR